jgi:hypothetical protein
MHLCSSRAQKDGLHHLLGGWWWWRFDGAVDCATRRRGREGTTHGRSEAGNAWEGDSRLGGVNTSAGGGG